MRFTWMPTSKRQVSGWWCPELTPNSIETWYVDFGLNVTVNSSTLKVHFCGNVTGDGPWDSEKYFWCLINSDLFGNNHYFRDFPKSLLWVPDVFWSGKDPHISLPSPGFLIQPVISGVLAPLVLGLPFASQVFPDASACGGSLAKCASRVQTSCLRELSSLILWYYWIILHRMLFTEADYTWCDSVCRYLNDRLVWRQIGRWRGGHWRCRSYID